MGIQHIGHPTARVLAVESGIQVIGRNPEP